MDSGHLCLCLLPWTWAERRGWGRGSGGSRRCPGEARGEGGPAWKPEVSGCAASPLPREPRQGPARAGRDRYCFWRAHKSPRRPTAHPGFLPEAIRFPLRPYIDAPGLDCAEVRAHAGLPDQPELGAPLALRREAPLSLPSRERGRAGRAGPGRAGAAAAAGAEPAARDRLRRAGGKKARAPRRCRRRRRSLSGKRWRRSGEPGDSSAPPPSGSTACCCSGAGRRAPRPPGAAPRRSPQEPAFECSLHFIFWWSRWIHSQLEALLLY